MQVMKGSLVYDPFVGTGSILVAAAHSGAVSIGADIDIRTVRDGRISLSGQVCGTSLPILTGLSVLSPDPF